MKNLILILVPFSLFLAACKKNKVELDDLMGDLQFSKTIIKADGKSTLDVWLEVSENSSPDRRQIVFNCTSGSFKESSSGTYTATAEYEKGVLIARATLKAPVGTTPITMTAQPEFKSPVKDYTRSGNIKVQESVADRIRLETSSNSIAGNYASEVELTGTLENADENPVSENQGVIFEDLLSNGQPANGRFRKIKDMAGDNSSVSAVYSAPALPLGNAITIKCTVTGTNPPISNSVILIINK